MSETPVEQNVSDAYCKLSDLRIGDIRLPSYIGDGTGDIKRAAQEIDAALGKLYITPIEIEDDPEYRPSILMLNKINWLIASGRIILNMAAAGEDDNQHAYGMGMLKEGLQLLKMLADGEMVLIGAERVDHDTPDDHFTGPKIFNEDPESLVKSFYEGRSPYAPPGTPFTQATPYGIPRRVV